MAKQCKCGCGYDVFSNGYAKFCQWKRKDYNPKPLKRTALKRSTTPIRKESKKLAQEKRKYTPLKKDYLESHTVCEVHDCDKPSTNLHHKKGRDRRMFADEWARENKISLLIDVRFFMACCETCHPQRIHENSEWAYLHGYLISK